MSASCSECRTLLGGYVLHALDQDDEARVRRHLESCEICRTEHEQLHGIPAVLDAAGPAAEVPIEQPPAALEEAVLDRFAREHPRQQRAPAAATKPQRRTARAWLRRPLPAALAGAVAAAAVTAALVVLPSGSGSGDKSGESYKANLAGANGAKASADLQVESSGTRVRLKVNGLRGTPNAVYELWCLRDDGEKVSAGTFRTDGSGNADVSLTTAAVPGEYHRLSIERKLFTPSGVEGERVMAGEIEYPHS